MAREMKSCSWRPIASTPDRLFQLEYQTCSNRFDNGRGAAFLAMFDVGEVVVLVRVHELDGAATRYVGDPVGE